MDTNQETSRTPARTVGNLNRCAYLMAHHIAPRSILSGDYVRFVFDDDGSVSDLLAQWDDGDALVEPRAFVSALNQARSLVAYHKMVEGAE